LTTAPDFYDIVFDNGAGPLQHVSGARMKNFGAGLFEYIKSSPFDLPDLVFTQHAKKNRAIFAKRRLDHIGLPSLKHNFVDQRLIA
jgi:hypothetical protein